MKQELLDQINHNEQLIAQHVTPEIQSAFEALKPSQHHQWTLDAIAARLPKAKRTAEDTSRYIGRIALVHLHQAKEELARWEAQEQNEA